MQVQVCHKQRVKKLEECYDKDHFHKVFRDDQSIAQVYSINAELHSLMALMLLTGHHIKMYFSRFPVQFLIAENYNLCTKDIFLKV